MGGGQSGYGVGWRVKWTGVGVGVDGRVDRGWVEGKVDRGWGSRTKWTGGGPYPLCPPPPPHHTQSGFRVGVEGRMDRGWRWRANG